MSEGFDPFGVDFNTDYYRNLLNKESEKSHQVEEQVQDCEFEEIKDEDQSDPQEFISKHTTQGLPSLPGLKGLLQDEQNLKVKNDKEAKALAQTFSNLFKELNNKYGLDVQLDFDSFSNSLAYIINPTNQKAMELYLSESYSRFRVLLYSKYLMSVARLSAQLLDPSYIESNSLSFADKMIVVEKLFAFMTSIEDIYERIKVKDSDLKLEKLGQDQHNMVDDLDSSNVQNFLEALKNNVKEGKTK